ncbi:hypothetical protein [Azonexus sp. IMCC34839]|uniref:hypothetical protein n=1 Tax=Azonexus sp. IMCC34839 TaxID=3133695 RepID=UPI003999D331
MTVSINGQVIEWDATNTEEIVISEVEIDDFEARGYAMLEISGQHRAIKFLPWPDGTIEIQAKSSWLAREFAKCGHTNFGYGGRFKCYLWVAGKRRTLVDFWKLFPNQEHCYEQQAHKAAAIARIESIVAASAGLKAVKTKGGWALFSESEAENVYA